MRIARSVQLYPESGTVHSYWRCHNKEYYLESPIHKELYFKCLKEALESKAVNGDVLLHSYCGMSNHAHLTNSHKNGSEKLSKGFHIAHTRFGARYNRRRNRSGKVAEGRPKTSLIEDGEHLMRTHFYVEANPIRAGICSLEKLKFYKYCSYKFYAHGIRDQFTELLTPPDWYLALGRTPRERQAKYRALFREYLSQSIRPFKDFLGYFIGSSSWKLDQIAFVKKVIKMRRNGSDYTTPNTE